MATRLMSRVRALADSGMGWPYTGIWRRRVAPRMISTCVGLGRVFADRRSARCGLASALAFAGRYCVWRFAVCINGDSEQGRPARVDALARLFRYSLAKARFRVATVRRCLGTTSGRAWTRASCAGHWKCRGKCLRWGEDTSTTAERASPSARARGAVGLVARGLIIRRIQLDKNPSHDRPSPVGCRAPELFPTPTNRFFAAIGVIVAVT